MNKKWLSLTINSLTRWFLIFNQPLQGVLFYSLISSYKISNEQNDTWQLQTHSLKTIKYNRLINLLSNDRHYFSALVAFEIQFPTQMSSYFYHRIPQQPRCTHSRTFSIPLTPSKRVTLVFWFQIPAGVRAFGARTTKRTAARVWIAARSTRTARAAWTARYTRTAGAAAGTTRSTRAAGRARTAWATGTTRRRPAARLTWSTRAAGAAWATRSAGVTWATWSTGLAWSAWSTWSTRAARATRASRATIRAAATATGIRHFEQFCPNKLWRNV